ncbi:Uncharacterised protein [Alistipes sp. cv1]|nr:Uncharacterised protein [Faecalibacterium prausnitzii]
MIMKILSTIVLLLTAVTLSAQPDAATCTGQTCTGQGSAIGFTTVSFFSETDSSAVYGALADSMGRFSVRIPHGNYRMEISLLGYEKKQRGITIAHDTDLGRIVLDPSEISLQGVEVRADPIVREADRFVVNVADMPQAIGRTAVEMLKLSPGVWIKDDIAIFGKKGAKVMINNRLLRETGEDLINYLNQIPAEDIQRIEIVPNSGAEYDADMTAGIIKITLKRKRDNGIDGAVGIYYSHAFSNASSTTSPSFNLNYRNDRLSLYASMGTWFSKQIIRITESSAFGQNDASIRSESRLDGRWKSVSPRIGALYEFNDRHSAGLEVSYFRNLPGGLETHNRLQKQDKADSTRIASHFLQNQQEYGLGISANYIFKMDTTGSLFKLLLDYYRRDNDDPTDYFSRYTGSQAFDTTYRGDIHTVNDLYAATAAFEIALGPVSKLRTGAKYTLNRMNTAILYEFLRDDAWHRIDRQSNLNRYSENIGALYADFSTKFKNGIGLNVGLRGEYTYAIPATSSTLITDRQNYFGLFPSANLSLPLNKKATQMLAFNYNRKISRPSFWNLNPYRMPLSEYSFLEGNPRLRPAYQNSYSVSWIIRHKYSLTVGFESVNGSSEQVATTDPDDPDIILYRYENVPIGRNFNLNVNVPTNITPWWMLNLNLTAMNCFSSLAGRQNTVQGYLNNALTIRKEWTLDLNLNYRTPRLWGNMRMSGQFNVGAGLRRSLLKKRLTASLTVHNLINYNKENIRIVEPTFERTVEQRQNWRQIAVSLRYNFKAGKEVKVRNVESGAAEEKSRF